MAFPDLFTRPQPAVSRWAIQAALVAMVALALLLMTLVAGLIDASPDGTSDLTAWLWRWGKPM